ncbi:tautomerase family protein [Streptomyces sp. NPDC005407]|uniref:tautomerase family protein n=1 Tax=Streptomyces sp. NPDC005407 TaxID=3155340 RepID=UPI0033ADB6F4
MPHINIKHFPAELAEEQRAALVSSVTKAVTEAFGCDPEVVSIALEPVDSAVWNEQVYVPEIVGRKDLLHKVPNY